jgi:hypothetical protein
MGNIIYCAYRIFMFTGFKELDTDQIKKHQYFCDTEKYFKSKLNGFKTRQL